MFLFGFELVFEFGLGCLMVFLFVKVFGFELGYLKGSVLVFALVLRLMSLLLLVFG